MLRPQRDEGPRRHWMPGRQAQAPALGDGRHDEDQLHPRERLANALARSSAEGEVRELRQRRLEFRRPASWIESARLLEEPWIAMRHPGAHQDDRACRRDITGD